MLKNYKPAPCDQAPYLCPYNSKSFEVCNFYCGFDGEFYEDENPYEDENYEEE